MAARTKRKAPPAPTLTVHQIVAYNFRRAREEWGMTQSETGERLEPFLGFRLNQAGVSAIEKTYDSERRRNIDVAEVVAFARCFERPLAWFFLPPPGHGADLLEPIQTGKNERHNVPVADLAAFGLGTIDGWDRFVQRMTELLRTDEGQTWDAMNLAFGGVRGDGWEAQIELRRNALRAATLVERATPGDEAITKMAQALLELVKLTPLGFELLRVKNPDEALALLARGDELAKRLSGYEPIDLRRIFDLPEEL